MIFTIIIIISSSSSSNLQAVSALWKVAAHTKKEVLFFCGAVCVYVCVCVWGG